MKVPFLTVFFFTLTCQLEPGMASDRSREPMNLGELEITGEVRRPNLFLVDTSGLETDALGTIALEGLQSFEKELLGEQP